MKNFENGLLKGINGLLASLLSLLGFSACEKLGGGGMVEYGTPYATYTIKGKVLAEEKPVEDAEVRIKMKEDYGSPDAIDTLRTDEKGAFVYEGGGFPDMNFMIITSMSDTIQGLPVWKPDTTTVSFEGVDYEGGSGWNVGHASKELTIQLQRYVDSSTLSY